LALWFGFSFSKKEEERRKKRMTHGKEIGEEGKRKKKV